MKHILGIVASTTKHFDASVTIARIAGEIVAVATNPAVGTHTAPQANYVPC